MGFSSMDDLINAMTVDETVKRTDWQKLMNPTTAAAAGEWHSLFRGAGNPGADSLLNTGTNLAFQSVSESTSGATSIPHGGDVAPLTKHIINASAFTTGATTVPCVLMLIDILAFYRVTSVTTITAQSTTGSGTPSTQYLPRYGTGAGVQAFFVNSNATPLGAGTPNLSLGYSNQAGTGSRATPTVLPVGKTAASNGLILYSGTGSGKYGPFVPLQAGDSGIRSVQTIQNSISYVSGEYSVVLCKPLLTLFFVTLGVASERDLINQVPSMPRVYDGACLTWLLYSSTTTPANTPFFGHLDFAWS
jgi:hypothetical protein